MKIATAITLFICVASFCATANNRHKPKKKKTKSEERISSFMKEVRKDLATNSTIVGKEGLKTLSVEFIDTSKQGVNSTTAKSGLLIYTH
jgi:hypothetical protein